MRRELDVDGGQSGIDACRFGICGQRRLEILRRKEAVFHAYRNSRFSSVAGCLKIFILFTSRAVKHNPGAPGYCPRS
ncbi:hypothetical protein R1flu_003974 [Riccia fluitans]|uniref:Ribosomal protein S14 n=1 Tax=Riccia fluitans TaxID=41844 RepID=A0ABD1YP01_9MARC